MWLRQRVRALSYLQCENVTFGCCFAATKHPSAATAVFTRMKDRKAACLLPSRSPASHSFETLSPFIIFAQLTAQATSSVILTFLFLFSMISCRQTQLNHRTSCFSLIHLPLLSLTGSRRQLIIRSSISMQVSSTTARNRTEVSHCIFALHLHP